MFNYCYANSVYKEVSPSLRAKTDNILSPLAFNYCLFDEKGIPCGNFKDYEILAQEIPDKFRKSSDHAIMYDYDGDMRVDIYLSFDKDGDQALESFTAYDNSTGDGFWFRTYKDRNYNMEYYDLEANKKYTEMTTESLISDKIKIRKSFESHLDENNNWVDEPSNLYEKFQEWFLEYASQNLIE